MSLISAFLMIRIKANAILSPSLNPSHQGREAKLLPLDGGGRVGVK
jgi:hypothetical protein